MRVLLPIQGILITLADQRLASGCEEYANAHFFFLFYHMAISAHVY